MFKEVIYMDRQHLLESPSGVLWNIYIDEDMHMVYSKKQNSSWSGAMPLDKFSIKSFSATIDMEDKVHIVAYTTTKQLIYYQWDGSQWLYSIMTTIRSRFQDIPFSKIVSDGDNVHVLYHVESALHRNKDVVYHYYGDGFNWQGGRIFSFPSEDNISIDSLYWYDKSYIDLYYSQKEDSKTLVYKSRFNKKNSLWGDPVPSFHIPLSLEKVQICVDDKKNEHLIGIHDEGDMYTLYYIPRDGKQIAVSSQPEPFTFPLITTLDRDIYMTWNIDDKILSSVLDKEREEFHRLRETHRNDMWLIDHVTVQSDGISYIRTSWKDIFSQTDVDDELKSYYYPKSDEIEILQRDIYSIKNQIVNFETQLDDLYSLFHTLKDYIMQYEKSLYQIQVSLKKQANEIAQIQNTPIQNKYQTPLNYSVPYNDSDDDTTEKEGEVVSLGDTKIIINNEDYEASDS